MKDTLEAGEGKPISKVENYPAGKSGTSKGKTHGRI